MLLILRVWAGEIIIVSGPEMTQSWATFGSGFRGFLFLEIPEAQKTTRRVRVGTLKIPQTLL